MLVRVLLFPVAALVLFSACGGGAPTCTQNSDCTLPALCSVAGKCEAPSPVADGEACSHDAHCTGQACVFTAEGGRCATACEDVADCATGRCAPTVDARAEGKRLRLTCTAAAGDR
jgi:hypothetical protein